MDRVPTFSLRALTSSRLLRARPEARYSSLVRSIIFFYWCGDAPKRLLMQCFLLTAHHLIGGILGWWRKMWSCRSTKRWVCRSHTKALASHKMGVLAKCLPLHTRTHTLSVSLPLPLLWRGAQGENKTESIVLARGSDGKFVMGFEKLAENRS